MNRVTFFRKHSALLDSLRNHKSVKRLLDLSARGMSPESLALSIALGFVLGLFPILGLPTLLCAAAAVVLRLNAPAIQVVNYLVYPLQLILLAPFIHLGRELFPLGRHVPVMPRLSAILHGDAWRAAAAMAAAAAHAVAGWFCICAPVGVVLYILLAYYLRARLRRSEA